MKSALVLSTSLATTLAAGPTAGRRLDVGTWNQNSGLSGLGTGATGNAAGACKFRSTAALFDHDWSIVEEAKNNVGGTYPNVGGQLTQGGVYHSNDMTFDQAAWSTNSLVLARFDVDLTFNNYNAAVKASSTKNYKYYDFNGAWTTGNDFDDNGKEQMARICVYKNSPTACGTNDITVEVSDYEVGGSSTLDGTPGTKVTLDIGLRKTIGIATTCGQSENAGDIKGALSDDAKDIFVWGAFDAQMSFEFQLVSNKHGPHHLTDASSTAALTAETDYSVNSYVIATATQPVTHDLLFIEDPVHQLESNLFSSHPKCSGGTDASLADGSANDHCENGVTTFRVDMDSTTEEAAGGLVLSTTSAKMSCKVELTVTPGVNGHWHCFRQSDVNTALNTQNTNIDNTDEPDASAGSMDMSGANAVDSSGSGTNPLNTLNGEAISGAGTCSATMKVTCSDPRVQVEGHDTRKCTIVDYGDAQDAKEARRTDFNKCLSSAWFSTSHVVYKDWAVFSGHYDVAMIQAVRLGQTRSYPYNAHQTSSALDVSDKFGTRSVSNWLCQDGGACSSSDPYKVLSGATMSLTNTLTGLTFPTNIDASSGLGVYNYATYAAALTAGFTAKCSGGDSSTDSTKPCYRKEVSAITCDLASTSDGSKQASPGCASATTAYTKPTASDASPNPGYGPSWTSGSVTLLDPPQGFPEAYLFGVASFSFSDNNHYTASASGDASMAPVTTYVETDSTSAQSQPVVARRLGSRSIPGGKLVEKTVIVDALQHVISK